MIPPRDRVILANRLRLHLVEWPIEGPVVLLLHGFLEHAHVWDWVAPWLAAAGFHVAALDWRGHGDSEPIGAGGYYHFADYVADLDALVRALGGRAALVAHSMGGNAAALYAGTAPERVAAMVLIEGVGPPDTDPAHAPQRYAAWLDDLARSAARRRPVLSFADGGGAPARELSAPRAGSARAPGALGTRAAGGGVTWKFDPLHQTRSPQPFYERQARAFWERVRCPVLYVEGDESPLRLPDSDLGARLAALRATRATIAGSGHHPHLEQPEALARVLIEFLQPHHR